MSDDQFQELREQIAAGFAKQDKKIGELDELITKLYQHTEGQFAKLHDEMDERFAKVHNRLDQVYDLVDEDLKRRETDEQERTAMNHQLDRHEDWINRASGQLGIGYDG